MAEQLIPEGAAEKLERAVENLQAHDLQFGRQWFYLTAAVLAWGESPTTCQCETRNDCTESLSGLFWEFADRHHENPHAQYLAWTAVFVAVWLIDAF